MELKVILFVLSVCLISKADPMKEGELCTELSTEIPSECLSEVTFHENPRFKGNKLSFEIQEGFCYELPDTDYRFRSLTSHTCVIIYEQPGCKGKKARIVKDDEKCGPSIGDCMRSRPQSIKTCDARPECHIKRSEDVSFFVEPYYKGDEFRVTIEEESCYEFARFPSRFSSLRSTTSVAIYGEPGCKRNETRIFNDDFKCRENLADCLGPSEELGKYILLEGAMTMCRGLTPFGHGG